MIKKKFKVIDGVRYYSDRPDRCRDCKFWKNRARGCMLGKENCCLAEGIMTEQEKKCAGCCYAKAAPCFSACCYRDLMKWFHGKKAGNADE